MKGRKPGTLNISYDKIHKILLMSQDGCCNSEISNAVGFSKKTVFKYKKKFFEKQKTI